MRAHAKLIDEKLTSIRVCDPAVGSGAFLVGMMTEIVRARCALTPYIQGDGDTGIPACDKEPELAYFYFLYQGVSGCFATIIYLITKFIGN